MHTCYVWDASTKRTRTIATHGADIAHAVMIHAYHKNPLRVHYAAHTDTYHNVARGVARTQAPRRVARPRYRSLGRTMEAARGAAHVSIGGQWSTSQALRAPRRAFAQARAKRFNALHDRNDDATTPMCRGRTHAQLGRATDNVGYAKPRRTPRCPRKARVRSYADVSRDRWIQSPECWPLHHRTIYTCGMARGRARARLMGGITAHHESHVHGGGERTAMRRAAHNADTARRGRVAWQQTSALGLCATTKQRARCDASRCGCGWERGRRVMVATLRVDGPKDPQRRYTRRACGQARGAQHLKKNHARSRRVHTGPRVGERTPAWPCDRAIDRVGCGRRGRARAAYTHRAQIDNAGATAWRACATRKRGVRCRV